MATHAAVVIAQLAKMTRLPKPGAMDITPPHRRTKNEAISAMTTHLAGTTQAGEGNAGISAASATIAAALPTPQANAFADRTMTSPANRLSPITLRSETTSDVPRKRGLDHKAFRPALTGRRN